MGNHSNVLVRQAVRVPFRRAEAQIGKLLSKQPDGDAERHQNRNPCVQGSGTILHEARALRQRLLARALIVGRVRVRAVHQKVDEHCSEQRGGHQRKEHLDEGPYRRRDINAATVVGTAETEGCHDSEQQEDAQNDDGGDQQTSLERIQGSQCRLVCLRPCLRNDVCLRRRRHEELIDFFDVDRVHLARKSIPIPIAEVTHECKGESYCRQEDLRTRVVVSTSRQLSLDDYWLGR